MELNLSGMANKGSGLSTPSYEKLLVEAQKESGMTSRNSSGHNRYTFAKTKICHIIVMSFVMS